MFELGDGRLIVQPRVLAKTIIVNRTVIDIRNPEIAIEEAQQVDTPEEERVFTEREVWMRQFWTELVATIRLDDAEQPRARPNHNSSIFWMFPLRAISG